MSTKYVRPMDLHERNDGCELYGCAPVVLADEHQKLVLKLDSIAQIASGDYGINTEHSMERIYSLATGKPMRKPCPECRGGEDGGPYRPRLGSGTIVIPCQTCHGTGRV